MSKKLVFGALAIGIMFSGIAGVSAATDSANDLKIRQNCEKMICLGK